MSTSPRATGADLTASQALAGQDHRGNDERPADRILATIVLDHIDPAQLVSCNRNLHHHQRAAVRRYWRTLTSVTARAQRMPTYHERVRIVVTFRWPDRRKRDVGNYGPYVAKGCVDGMVDARCLPDDDDLHLIGPDLRRDPEPGPHRITIKIETPGRAS